MEILQLNIYFHLNDSKQLYYLFNFLNALNIMHLRVKKKTDFLYQTVN